MKRVTATCVFLGTRMPPVNFFGGDPGTRAPLIAATNGFAGWLPRVQLFFWSIQVVNVSLRTLRFRNQLKLPTVYLNSIDFRTPISNRHRFSNVSDARVLDVFEAQSTLLRVGWEGVVYLGRLV